MKNNFARLPIDCPEKGVFEGLKVALVHDWLTGMRGGEKCLEVFCELFPKADLFTLLHIPGKISEKIESLPIHTSLIQKLPLAIRNYRNYLPLFPTAIERFDFSPYDFILSSSHCVAKGAIPKPDALHLCYCYTPMRYVWDMYPLYFRGGGKGWLKKIIIPPVSTYLRMWDSASSSRVDSFIAISRHVARRIWKYYNREAEVIYPPVDGSFFCAEGKEENYYLVVSALVPYKRIDLAIQASNSMGFRLLIVGEGSEEKYLKKIAGKNVEFLGWQSSSALRESYTRCRAFIFPGEEDFGITPLEAMASGKPVIAYGRGGALETVIPLDGVSDFWETEEGPTGIFFYEQNVESLIRAIQLYEKSSKQFDPNTLRRHALKFDCPIFKEKIKGFVAEKILEWKKGSLLRGKKRA